MIDDVLLAKRESLERCISQIRRYQREATTAPLDSDYLRQDAIAMNLQRACEAAIDLANRVIRLRKLGLPQENRASFRLLVHAGLIDQRLADSMIQMVGFRNVLVHRYQDVDPQILREVLDHRLDDLLEFALRVTAASADGGSPPA